MKLHFRIKSPVDGYAVKFLAAVSALIGFEWLFHIVCLDEMLMQILIFSILGAFGLYRCLKRVDDD